MVEVSLIAKENGSGSILMENKFTIVVLYILFKFKKYSAIEIILDGIFREVHCPDFNCLT